MAPNQRLRRHAEGQAMTAYDALTRAQVEQLRHMTAHLAPPENGGHKSCKVTQVLMLQLCDLALVALRDSLPANTAEEVKAALDEGATRLGAYAPPAVQNDTGASDPCVREECCRLRKLINEHYGPENSRLKDELLALSETPANGTAKVPEGWKLVPRVPTDNMVRDAAEIGFFEESVRKIYRAMLAAAPTGNEERK